MKKKILFVITKSSWGGAQRYVYDLATHLPPEDYDVAVAAGGDGALFERLDEAGIRAIPITGLGRDISLVGEFTALRALVRLLQNERPDIVHLNSSKIGGLGALAVLIFRFLNLFTVRPRVVFTAHGWGFYEDRSALARAAIFLVSFISSLLQDAIITIDTADWRAARRFIPARKLHLIFNGIGEENFLPRDAARDFLTQKIARPITDDTLLIGVIAELTSNKGLMYLIDAFTHMADAPQEPISHLVIIGEGEEHTALETKIKNLGLEKSITLTGFNPDARAALAGIDIFVLPSLKEGLPYAVMEAMSAGLPIVATRVGGLPDMITSGKNGVLVPPRDSATLARAITMLARDADLRRRMGIAAQEKIKTKFSFHAMIDATIALYI